MPYNTDGGGDDDGDYGATTMWNFSSEPHFRECSADDLMYPLKQWKSKWYFRISIDIQNAVIFIVHTEKDTSNEFDGVVQQKCCLPKILLNFVPGLCGVTLIIGTILLFMW